MDRVVPSSSVTRLRWETLKGKDGPRSVGRGVKQMNSWQISLEGSGSRAPSWIVRRANRIGCLRIFVL